MNAANVNWNEISDGIDKMSTRKSIQKIVRIKQEVNEQYCSSGKDGGLQDVRISSGAFVNCLQSVSLVTL